MNLRMQDKAIHKLKSRLFPFGKDNAIGKWLIVPIIAFILLLITSNRSYGQVVSSNPGGTTEENAK